MSVLKFREERFAERKREGGQDGSIQKTPEAEDKAFELASCRLRSGPARDRHDHANTTCPESGPGREQDELAGQREEVSLEARHLATIAHEMKNPLQALENILHLLHNGKLAAEDLEFVTLAKRELSRLKHIATQVLHSAHSSAKVEEVCLAELVAGSLGSHSEKIGQKKVAIFRRLECNGRIKAVPVETRQVLDNLLANALDAVPQEGKVVVHLYESRDWRRPKLTGYRIVIADNGYGIPEQNRKKIFQPFFTTKSETGTGLGLWVAQRIVREHRGSIRMRSSVRAGNSGTVFSIFLPSPKAEEPFAKGTPLLADPYAA